MTATKPTIWLAMITEDESEYHIRFDGHESVESAKKEITEINGRLMRDKKIPLPYYIYEAYEPLHGYAAYNLDDLDFNFYKELTEEEKQLKNKKVKELEKALESGDEKVIEETAKKIIEESKNKDK